MKGTNPRAMRRLTARSKLRAAQALLLLRTIAVKSSSIQSSTLPQAVGVSVRDLQKRHSYLFCFAELQETRLLCTEESLGEALGLKFTPASADGKVQVVAGDPKPLVRTWMHDEGALTEAMELARDVLLAARVTDSSIWKTVLTTLLHHDHGRPLLQTLLNLINANLLPSLLHDETELRNQLTAYVARFVEEAAEKLGQIWDVVRLKVQSSMAESAAAQAKQVSAASYSKQHDANISVSISKQELQRLLSAAESGASGDKGGEKEREKGAGPTSADINQALSGPGGLPKARRTLLVERCQASVLGWEEPPEELILSFSQATKLWSYFSDGTVHTVSKEYQSKVGAACQKILSLLCQTFSLPSSVSYDGEASGLNRRQTVDEALRQSGLQCMLSLIRSSCSGLTDLRKLVHADAADATTVAASSSARVIVPFLESLLIMVIKQSNAAAGVGPSEFANQCLWGLFSTCCACLPKSMAMQLMSTVMSRLQECDSAAEVLTRLLRLSIAQWTACEDSLRAAAVVFSWCLRLPTANRDNGTSSRSNGASSDKASTDQSEDEGNEGENEDEDDELIGLVQAAVSELRKTDHNQLRVAVCGLSGNLSKDAQQRIQVLFTQEV